MTADPTSPADRHPRAAVVFVTRGENNLFSVVKVTREFGPRAYPATILALQASAGAKLLDLTSATVISLDVFEQLARGWTVPPGTVPRLAIALSFQSVSQFRGIREIVRHPRWGSRH